jgi:polyisoprenoid-binding protein YceI
VIARIVCSFVIALAAGAAHAENVVADKSEIGFTVKQMGVNFAGRFTRWRADVVFEPRALARSKADIDVELASIDLASAESGRRRRARAGSTPGSFRSRASRRRRSATSAATATTSSASSRSRA